MSCHSLFSSVTHTHTHTHAHTQHFGSVTDNRIQAFSYLSIKLTSPLNIRQAMVIAPLAPPTPTPDKHSYHSHSQAISSIKFLDVSNSKPLSLPRREEPGRLQSMGSLGVGQDWVASLSLFTFMHWRRKWKPTPVFLPGESQGRGSLVGCCL